MFKNQRGGAAVEFAIVVPLLALILFGTIDFALLFYNKQVLTNASREGARSAIVADNWGSQYVDGVLTITDVTEFKIIIETYCSNRLISLGGANDLDSDQISVDDDPADFITVTVPYNYEHLFSSITGAGTTTITGKTVMRQEW
ncbi:TadE/TadG family type IV pilus assembly protein [Desulfobacula sp.]|uniref:TadE/TadG family type IV pilus assembly protein n=1 Tax=Desulfobacula sp. TaxID=2593537 RepID=UPI0025C620CB|nr:TadE family protein [Desulfobacula sp.]MBC2705442.1 pilus assembly protein [Desulfobacula sp.]